jgi:membrane protease YdiL (CAAX protease family)
MCKKINIFAPVLFGFYIIVSMLFSRIIYSNGIALPLWLNLIISQCILLIPALIYVLVMKIDIIKCIPYRKIKLSDAVSSLLIGYCLVPLVLLINVISSVFATNYLNSSTTEISQYPFVIQLLLMAFLPTIAEEFVFRGLFYHSYRKNGILGAAILSGVIFGAIHLNINQFCYACVMGMVFALMVEITGSMFSSMLAHFAVNSYSIIMLKLVSMSGISVQTEQASQQMMSQYSGVIILLQIAILAVTAIAFISIAYLLFMSMAKRNGRWDYFKLNMKKGLRPQNNEHFITIPLAATLLAAAAFMIFQELA